MNTSTKTFTAREFNQDIAKAKREAKTAPVIITDRGKPSHVLLSYEDYTTLNPTKEKLHKSIVDMLAMPESADFDFEFPKMNFKSKPVEFD